MNEHHPAFRRKRLFDLVLVFCALPFWGPLLILCAFLVRILDGSPVLFRQTRVGMNFEPFQVLKLRTMKMPSQPSNNAEPGAELKITARSDSRITSLGKWLRLLKLDELPQLINVVRGEMSLVGSRPEVPDYVERDDLWSEILSLPPGITDLSSLAFRDEEDLLANHVDTEMVYRTYILPEKLRLAARSVREDSIRQNLQIIVKTIEVIFTHREVEAPLLNEVRARILHHKE